MRVFDSGATRDSEDGKLDFDGFLSPEALLMFAEYMHKHRIQPDGSMRDGGNWKKGIPLDAYRKSMWRHFFDVWYAMHYAGEAKASRIDLQDSLCALLFNIQGILDTLAREKTAGEMDAENDNGLSAV